MKILLLITNLGKGGAQRVFYDQSVALSRFYEVQEAVFNISEDARLLDSGRPLHSLDVGAGTNPLDKLLQIFRRARRLRALIRKGGFDLVISHLDGANWVNVLAGTKAKKILVLHGTVLNDSGIARPVQWLRRHLLFPVLYNKADCTVAVSEGICDELKSCGVKKVLALPNFFNVKLILEKALQQLPRHLETFFRENQVLITSGRLAPEKNQDFLIRVFARLKQQGALGKLVLLGDGPMRESLMQCARDEGLSFFDAWSGIEFTADKDVYFFGYLDNPFSYLSRSTVFLFPSSFEGFPMSLCEAMLCKLPVLTADCPTGVREIVAPETGYRPKGIQHAELIKYGYLLPLSDAAGAIDAWADTVSNLLANQPQREQMGGAGCLRIQDYDTAKVIGRWQDLINSLFR